MDTKKIESIIGYKFGDKRLLKKAMTHSSYINEKSNMENNERLEFLGDAVLEVIISDYLYKNCPSKTEGELTKIRAKIVCTESLSSVSAHNDFGKYILMGKGEENTGGRERKSILANTFEAIIGAVYLDGGIQDAEKVILGLLSENITESINGNLVFDYKTKLQEIVQQKSESFAEYTVSKEVGPEHNKIFYVDLIYNDKVIGKGKGNNKKEAEQKAAYRGLVYLGVLDEK
ncbi:ribonuclease III [Alkalibacter mobilis]|uniref:ribonuclease III n=1 Tax=Alkalibacter mobilis TaxID=2787712 RepID=UPI002FC2CF64